MSAYLAYSYSANLTIKEQTEIDEKTAKSREEFSRGFVRGVSFSLAAYYLYSLATSAAYAEELNVPAEKPKTPGPAKKPKPPGPAKKPKPPGAAGALAPKPRAKPGFKPLSEGVKGAFVGGAGAICGAALQSGDFCLGIACALLLVVGGIVINRP